jgi:hypothetical protein
MPKRKVAGPGIQLLLILAILITAVCITSCGGKGNSDTHTTPVPLGQNNQNLIGINIAAPLDYEEDRLYADVIRMSRTFTVGADENISTAAQLDADGWPTADFNFYVWASLGKRNGTYTLTFTGKANVYAHPVGNVALSYDELNNKSTGTIQYSNASASFLALRFTNTQRTSNSASGTGVTSIHLMRPLSPGATQSYPATTLFTTPIKSLINKFSVIRFMDFLATNSNQQKEWGERPLPAWPSFNRYSGKNGYGWQGIGGCWEHLILLANETGKDAWINIPANASDTYITNVANILKYGSDGVTPYTSVQANPAYPPLNANLKIYVEYSNELWNTASAFSQSQDISQRASDELVATSGSSPLNWDSSWTGGIYDRAAPSNWNWNFTWRYIAKRGVDISVLFRSVFGDAEMGTRIRPLLMTQLGAPTRVLGPAAKMLLDYYDNMGGNYVATPHPPSYYFYGAGGSGYYNPASTVSTLDALFADPGMTPAGVTPAFQGDATLVAAMGLKRVAYEGGPSLDKLGGAIDAVSLQAVNDPRMTTAIVDIHNTWSNNGGDLLVYYRATGDQQWGFTSDIYNLTTPKLAAIDALNVASRAPLTFGTLVPGSLAGSAANNCSRMWGCSPIATWDNFTADGSRIVWASYTFRSAASSPWTVNLAVTGATNATVAVYIDGKLVTSQPTTGGTLSFNAGTVSTGMHGVIVRAVAGSFSIGSVAVELK